MIKSRVTFGVSLFVSMFGLACGDSGGGSAQGATCEQVCRHIEAPHCGNAAPNCQASCEEEKLNTPMDCEAELNALTSCFAGATFRCDADDAPQADACKSALDRWSSCSNNGAPAPGKDPNESDGGQTSDAAPGDGDGDSNANVCSASPDDEACDTCLKGACCEEIAACGPDCLRILDCVSSCADDDCVNLCLTDNPNGAAPFSALTTCMVQSCSDSCDLGS